MHADFFVISERRWSDWPVVYEKLQIQELARERGDDWSIYIDSDALVHPEIIDFTNFLPRDTVMHNGCDMANVRWDYDEYFLRDGRNIGSCNWCAFASSWCRDLWTPLDISLEEALSRIHPTVDELNTVITADHLIDDYTLSRNIAKFGLKFTTVTEMLPKLGLANAGFFWHAYTITADEKLEKMQEVIKNWRI